MHATKQAKRRRGCAKLGSLLTPFTSLRSRLLFAFGAIPLVWKRRLNPNARDMKLLEGERDACESLFNDCMMQESVGMLRKRAPPSERNSSSG